MHKFLRAVGFSMYQKRRDIEELLELLEKKQGREQSFREDAETEICTFQAETAPGMGILVVGVREADGKLRRDFYFPYLENPEKSTEAECTVQRHAERETCVGMVDESRVGISMIFYVQNFLDYWERNRNREKKFGIQSVNFSALSVSGKILLPIKKTKKQIQKARVASKNRTDLIEAAKNGDEDAMESLTIEDIDLYSKISRRAMKEDIYSIIDSCFMPSGFECDQYLVIGEIREVEKVKNQYTNEEIYKMRLECNDLYFMVCINCRDLMGEPAVGRRFKGEIWMQGILNFSS